MSDHGPLPLSVCPQCGYKLDGASNTDGDGAPGAGDASVCLNCGQVLMFNSDLTLRKADALDVRELMDSAEAWAIIEKAQMIIRQRGRFR